MIPIYVEWLDSAGPDGWVTETPKPTTEPVKTLGWLLAQSDEAIVVGSHIAPECIHAPITIPRCAINAIYEFDLP